MFSELLEESVTKDDIEAVVKAKNLYGSCMNTSTSYPLHWWEWKKLKKMSNWNRCTKRICWLSQLTIFTRVKFTNLRRVHTYICYRRFTSFFFSIDSPDRGRWYICGTATFKGGRRLADTGEERGRKLEWGELFSGFPHRQYQ